MRRTTHAQAEALAAVKDRVRAILKLYVQRKQEESQAKGSSSMTAIVIDVLRRGCVADSSPDLNALRMTSRQRWLVNMEWVLREIGVVNSAILIARLTRRDKSVEASYATISGEIKEAAGLDLIESEVKKRFAVALSRFVQLIDERGIDRNCSEESSTSLTYRRGMTVAAQADDDVTAAAREPQRERAQASVVSIVDALQLIGAASRGKLRLQTVARRLRSRTRIAEAV